MAQSLDLYRRCAWCGRSCFVHKAGLIITGHMRRGTRPAVACPGGGRPLVEHMQHLKAKQDQKLLEFIRTTTLQLTPEQTALLPGFIAQLEKKK